MKIYSEPDKVGQRSRRQDEPAADAAEARHVAALPGGTERVLLVEDNVELRRTAERILKRLGYAVVIAGNGDEAIELLGDGAGFDLVFTDLVMPGGMNGLDVIAEARRRRPQIRCLLATGFADVAGELAATLATVVYKPYRMEQLARVVRAVIDDSGVKS